MRERAAKLRSHPRSAPGRDRCVSSSGGAPDVAAALTLTQTLDRERDRKWTGRGNQEFTNLRMTRSKRKIHKTLSGGEDSVDEDSQVTITMSHAEIDDLFFERRRVRLCLGAEHEPLRGRRIHSVRFDRNVVVVAHDKGHLGKLLAGLTVQDGVEVVEGFSPFSPFRALRCRRTRFVEYRNWTPAGFLLFEERCC